MTVCRARTSERRQVGSTSSSSATENPRIASPCNRKHLVSFFYNTFYRYLIPDALVCVIATINSHEFHIFSPQIVWNWVKCPLMRLAREEKLGRLLFAQKWIGEAFGMKAKREMLMLPNNVKLRQRSEKKLCDLGQALSAKWVVRS